MLKVIILLFVIAIAFTSCDDKPAWTPSPDWDTIPTAPGEVWEPAPGQDTGIYTPGNIKGGI